MVRKAKTLVNFNAKYYQDANAVPSGYSARYLANRQSLPQFYKMVNSSFIDASDVNLLRTLQEKHGIFAEKFFHQNIRARVTRKYAELGIPLDEYQKMLSGTVGYELYLYNKWDAIYHIIGSIFEQLCLGLKADPHHSRILDEWFTLFSKPRTCVLCGHIFRVVDIPYWVYWGANGFKECCFQCQIVESPTKKELIELIPEFIKSCGFIPNSSANPINFSFTSRLSYEQWAKVISNYAKIGTVEHVKKKFGTWFQALVQTNTLPEGVQATARGVRCLAKDGHICHSLDEQRIDDWLFFHHIPHDREPYYPVHSTLNSTARRRADWKVEDRFIEYFGLIGDTAYEKKMDEKIMLAHIFGIELIEIYPSDIERLEQILCEKLVLKNL